MRPAQNIIRRPLLTEKSTTLRETGGSGAVIDEESNFGQKVVFEVASDANKIQIRNAVQELWKVKVADVHTMIVRGKTKRVGRSTGWRPGFKKAIVTLKAGENIEFYEGV
ncbi:MAG: 50S ribosomal protein L23 [Myxococcales bacterium]|nr:50S ribosomal protein L23 [Myxococcales bacterium]